MKFLLFFFEKGPMEEIKIIENMLNEHLAKTSLTLYKVEKVNEFGFKILRVLIDSKTYVSTDEIQSINQFLSEKLDQIEIYNGEEYMLEVSSAGLEKEIRNRAELEESIGNYAFITTKEFERYGHIIDFKSDVIEFKINLKGRMKVVKINYEDALFIRNAVKF